MLTYTLTINEAQLKVMTVALEEFFRLRLGQCWDLVDDLAFSGFDYKNHTAKEFDERIRRRDDARSIIQTGMNVAFGQSVCRDIGDIGRICEDMWSVARHQLWKDNPNHSEWTVDSYEPRPVSNEPLMTIQRIEH